MCVCDEGGKESMICMMFVCVCVCVCVCVFMCRYGSRVKCWRMRKGGEEQIPMLTITHSLSWSNLLFALT